MKNLEAENIATVEENLAEEKLRVFESQQEIIRDIYEVGFARHVENLPNLADAFDMEKHKQAENLHNCCCCIDERVLYGSVRAAGSGILKSKKDFEEFFKKSGADSISSHRQCGAAKVYAEQMGLTGDPDQIAAEWAKSMAEELGVPYIEQDVERDFHSARVVYYSKKKFNYAGVEGLPEGFMVSRLDESAIEDVKLAANIAFGHHGLGKELLNAENPFVFVAVAETEKELKALKKELTKLAKLFGSSVIVDGFLAP